MSKKDAAVIKALTDLGLRKEPDLTPEQEEELEIAKSEELQYLRDLKSLYDKDSQ